MTRSKTMFASSVCCSDRYSTLSFEAQALYYRLNLEADGIGTLNNVKTIMRAAGFSEGALSELLDAGYLLNIDSGFDDVYLVADFWVNNNIDRRNVGRSEHTEIVLSKCCFHSERIKRYRLVKDDSDCVQSGFSLGSVLKPSLNQTNPNKTKPTPTPSQAAKSTAQSNCPTPKTAACPGCNSQCAVSTEGNTLHGWCQLHGDFFIDSTTGEYLKGIA